MGEQRITFTAAISNGTAKTALDKSLGGLGAEVSDKWLGRTPPKAEASQPHPDGVQYALVWPRVTPRRDCAWQDLIGGRSIKSAGRQRFVAGFRGRRCLDRQRHQA